MAEIRRDPLTGRWIIISTDQPLGPQDFKKEARPSGTQKCPFCPGNEGLTPPEIAAHRSNGGSANGPSWTWRVIPNKFPALRIEGGLNRAGVGLYDMMNGVGAHEVVIETPDHTKTLPDLPQKEVEQILTILQERYKDLKKDGRFRYILIFKNSGEPAGASLSHSHSQLIALPIVPKRVSEEIENARAYLKQKDRCVLCDVVHQELSDGERIVMESSHLISFTPFASRFPFELCILPKEHAHEFSESQPDLVADLAQMLRTVLEKVRQTLGDPSYNFILHTSPLAGISAQEYHWHLELIPRLTRAAGFEWGSGFYINPTPPELAARYLRGEK